MHLDEGDECGRFALEGYAALGDVGFDEHAAVELALRVGCVYVLPLVQLALYAHLDLAPIHSNQQRYLIGGILHRHIKLHILKIKPTPSHSLPIPVHQLRVTHAQAHTAQSLN